MALNLSAEQKNIRTMFFNVNQYVIPEYQRAYSWGNEQCYQLYIDLVQAYRGGDEYFLGNIVLAKSKERVNQPQIIDGQQRMISLWLLLKVLSIFVVDIDLESNVLILKAWKKGEDDRLKIESHVLENADGDAIKKILEYDKCQFEKRLSETLDKNSVVRTDKCYGNVEYAALLFYQYLSQNDIVSDDYENMTNYLLDKVMLLPIELGGDNIAEAQERALSIFETINNRGMDLQDADIFKARLYSNALSQNQNEIFMCSWKQLTERVSILQISIDDVFRYYYHIIRGKNGIVTSEKKLRDFFLNDKLSPLTYQTYDATLKELFKITDKIEKLNLYLEEDSDVVSWLQVLNVYTNVYPKFALVTYLFKNEVVDEVDFLQYIKSIVRYVYYAGSTTSVKFGIYAIIQRVMEGLPMENYYRKNFSVLELSSSSRLLPGLSLIAYYMSGRPVIKSPCVEKILYESDLKNALNMFANYGEDMISTSSNYYVLKKSIRYKTVEERYKMIKNNPTFNACLDDQGRVDFKRRQEIVNTLLSNFFTGDETI